MEDDDHDSDSIDGAECDPLVNRTLDNDTNDNDQEDEEEENIVDLQQVGEDLEEKSWKFLVMTEFPYMCHRTP